MPIPNRKTKIVRTQSDLRGYHNTRMSLTGLESPVRMILSTSQTDDGTYKGGAISIETNQGVNTQIDLGELDLMALYDQLKSVFEPGALCG